MFKELIFTAKTNANKITANLSYKRGILLSNIPTITAKMARAAVYQSHKMKPVR